MTNTHQITRTERKDRLLRTLQILKANNQTHTKLFYDTLDEILRLT